MAEFVLVMTTMPAEGGADELARRLVDERLAACVNVLPTMQSTYRWQGAVQLGEERQLVMKTSTARLPELERRLHELHPDEVPEFLVVPIDGGSAAYLAWVRASVAGS